MFAIRHATLLTPEDSVADALVLIDEGRIAAVDAADASPPEGVVVRDATGLLLAPGFIDLQLNGGFGLDFTADPTTIWDVAAALPRFGVTAFLPTIITSPPAVARAAQRVLGARYEELGVALARSWGFPEVIQNSMRKLPDGPARAPVDADERQRVLAACANAAGFVVV